MTPAESKSELIRRIGIPLEQLNARQGMDLMLAFYEQLRAECSPLNEDGDMLLFQWGTYNFSGSPIFQLDITRQCMVPNEDEPHQLSLTFYYNTTEVTESLKSGNKWCYRPDKLREFRQFIDDSAAFSAYADSKPSLVELDFSQC